MGFNRQKLYDRLASLVIRLGGVGLIITVLGIFVFMVAQTLPLFFGATVSKLNTLSLQEENPLFLGLDEWGERPFTISQQGDLHVYFANSPQKSPEIFQPFAEYPHLKPQAWDPVSQTILFANSGGEIALAQFLWERAFDSNIPQVNVKISRGRLMCLSQSDKAGQAGSSLPTSGDDAEKNTDQGSCDLGGNSLVPPFALQANENSAVILGTLQDPQQTATVIGMKLEKHASLLGEGEWEVAEQFQLPIGALRESPLPSKDLQHLILNPDQDTLLLGLADGEVQYWQGEGNRFAYRNSFYPFENPKASTSMHFLQGGGSVYFTNASGKNGVWSLLIPEGEKTHRWVQIQSFPDLASTDSQTPLSFAKSLRNRAFLVTQGKDASLRYSTTGDVRWEQKFNNNLVASALSEKYHRIALLDKDHHLSIFKLDDPHPEGGFKAFFSKLWYEGGEKPTYQWQSTGGSDAFEPKLSMIPLIIGTLKGTLYSLLFAVPLALLAALYTSEFLHPRWKQLLKPLMEIMASLPSVILGFLAALWLAPILANAIPALILLILGLPLVSLLSALIYQQVWQRLPESWQFKLPGKFLEKHEWLWLLPIVLITAIAAWYGGPILERWAFVVTDPTNNTSVANFQAWWRNLGGGFEMRNAIVVGIVMGFAVIPLIFTLAEESFSAVPKGLRSASLALGATPWQTAVRVVLPTAAVGVFSAVMIGLGRAVGETMIVLMATGNTPLLDLDPFTGMRTLSANLAVELPEAPFQGTLYRTLFFGAVLLFIFTFGVNSLAEILHERIRKKSGGKK